MTKSIVQKISRKLLPPAPRSAEAVARARRFDELALKNGARELEFKIAKAIEKSKERREEVRKPGRVTVSISS